METFIADIIEVQLLCLSKQPELTPEEVKELSMLTELGLPIPPDLKAKSEVENEWRPATIITRNIEGFYPDFSKKHTVFQMLSGSVLQIRQTYPEVKALMQGGFYATS